MNKSCPECGQTIYGRADKKFCSDSCRNSFNNRQSANASNLVKNTNNQLKKNRRILELLCPGDKARVSRRTLLEKGFSFELMTSLRVTKNGHSYYFVYEFGYLALENNNYLIVRDNRQKEEHEHIS